MRTPSLIRRYALGFLVILMPAACSTVQTTVTTPSATHSLSTPLLPDDRQIDWSGAGVYVNGVKGIPTYAVGVDAKSAPYNAKGDGTADDTSAIQKAINACAAGQAVLLPQGTYRVSGTLMINKGIVVRGEGPDKTKIIQYGSKNIFRIQGTAASSMADITSGFTKGSDTVGVSNAFAFSAGDVVSVDELNDPTFVSHHGAGGACTWCGRYGASGGRTLGELKIIKQASGHSVTFTRPLYLTYKAELAPQIVTISSNPVRNAGVENLYMEAAAVSKDGHSVFMSNCVHCWVKGVESYNTARKHIELQSGAYGNEVRDSYIHEAHQYTSDHGYGINISLGSSDNLVENNILYHLHYAIAHEAGGAGNVFAYNYQERTEHYETDWYIQAMGTHGSHTYMNLWEGNVAGMIDFDNYWGSGSHQVVLRNHLTRENPGTPVTNNVIAAIVDAQNYYDTFIGNILGSPGSAGVVEAIPYRSISNPVIWKIGFNCCSAKGDPIDPKSGATLIRHGNFDYITNALTWDSNIANRTIPNSLYLPAKPAWFGSLVWPPFTPEAAGFNPNALNKIPAQLHFEKGPKLGLPFDPQYGN